MKASGNLSFKVFRKLKGCLQLLNNLKSEKVEQSIDYNQYNMLSIHKLTDKQSNENFKN